MDRLREAHGEELLLSETSSQQAVQMAQQEQAGLKAKLEKALADLEVVRGELER